MRTRSTLAVLLAGTTYALAQPGADLPPPPTDPAPVEEAPPPPALPVTITPLPPGSAVPPIVINITNNNTGNNSNTNTQTNNNTQANTQTNSVPVTNTVTISPPSAAPLIAAARPFARAPIATYELITRRPESNKWLAVGIIGGPGGTGVRAQLDLLTRGSFSLGIAGTLGAGGRDEHGGRGGHHERGGRRGGDERGGGGGSSAVAYLAWTGTIGPLDLRAQVGLGVGSRGDEARRGHLDMSSRSTTGTGTTTTTGDDDPSRGRDGRPQLAPRAEAALLVGLPLTHHLGLVGGPVVSTSLDHDKRAVDGQVMAGLRWRF